MRSAIRKIFRFLWISVALFLIVQGAIVWSIVHKLDDRTLEAALSRPMMLVHVTAPDQVDGFPCNCNRTLRADEVPATVHDALIATEDSRFYYHPGVDPISIVAAVASGGARGGSTITQQLVKTAITGDYPTLLRKLVEAGFALRIERLYTKDDLLRLYLSRVSFGTVDGIQVYGLRDAARVYFGKEPTGLNRYEAAILVGMLKGTSYYHPIRKRQAALDRALVVMGNAGTAKDDAADRKALARALPRKAVASPERSRFVEDELLSEFRTLGLARTPGWYRIISSIDPIAQYQVERVTEAELRAAPGSNASRAAVLSVDREGYVLAMLGGRDYARSTFNIAMQGERQAASTAKIATYLAALENGWSADDPVWDAQSRLQGFVPRNADDRYLGRIPLARCFRESRNVCTVWLAEQVGMDKVAEMAQRIGLTARREPGQSVVLGAAETTLAQSVAAFGAVANDGRVRRPTTVLAVLGALGRITLQNTPDARGPVLDPSTRERMRALLRLVVTEGTGGNAQFSGANAYGKTGTSQRNRDAWFIGFTSDGITTGVWVGPDDTEVMHGVAGGGLPAQIFSRYNINLVERFRAYGASGHAAGTPLPR